MISGRWNQKKNGASAEPVGASAEPVGASAEPVEASAEPVGASAEPVGASAEPVGASAEPVGASAEPVGASAEPVGASAEPVEIPQHCKIYLVRLKPDAQAAERSRSREEAGISRTTRTMSCFCRYTALARFLESYSIKTPPSGNHYIISYTGYQYFIAYMIQKDIKSDKKTLLFYPVHDIIYMIG